MFFNSGAKGEGVSVYKWKARVKPISWQQNKSLVHRRRGDQDGQMDRRYDRSNSHTHVTPLPIHFHGVCICVCVCVRVCVCRGQSSPCGHTTLYPEWVSDTVEVEREVVGCWCGWCKGGFKWQIKLWQLQSNLYSAGSGLMRLKKGQNPIAPAKMLHRDTLLLGCARVCVSICVCVCVAWCVWSWLRHSLAPAHGVCSGNNANTSHGVMAYSWRSAASYSAATPPAYCSLKPYSSVAHMLLVVMFSLPYQFCRGGEFYYGAYLVCHSRIASL